MSRLSYVISDQSVRMLEESFYETESEHEGGNKIQMPDQILQKMRLNKNFANVYTPFHNFESIYITEIEDHSILEAQ